MHVCQSLQGWSMSILYFCRALCSYNTSQYIICCRFPRDGQDKALLQWHAWQRAVVCQKDLLSLTSLHNKQGLRHHIYRSLACQTEIAVEILCTSQMNSVFGVQDVGPQLHRCYKQAFAAHLSAVNSLLSDLTLRPALWRGVGIQEGSLRCCKLWQSIGCMCWASTGPERWLHKDSEISTENNVTSSGSFSWLMCAQLRNQFGCLRQFYTFDLTCLCTSM